MGLSNRAVAKWLDAHGWRAFLDGNASRSDFLRELSIEAHNGAVERVQEELDQVGRGARTGRGGR